MTIIDDDALAIERLRVWVKKHFGIWITHRTAKMALRAIVGGKL